MRRIIKSEAPQAYTDWLAQKNEDWQPSFGELSGAVKDAVYQSLLEEQGYICCYCERRLKKDDYHLEHLQPQSAPGVDPLDYSNFLCSCQKRLEKGEPRHCGNSKGNEKLPITPLDANITAQFSYRGDGRICPASNKDQEIVQKTIDILALNIPKLQAMRRAVIETFLDPAIEDDMQTYLRAYSQKDSDGKYGEFCSAVQSIFSIRH